MADSRKTFRARLLDAIRAASAQPGQFACGYHEALRDIEMIVGHGTPRDMLGVWNHGQEVCTRSGTSRTPARAPSGMLRNALDNGTRAGAK